MKHRVSAVGIIQATETIKALVDIGESLTGRLLVLVAPVTASPDPAHPTGIRDSSVTPSLSV